MEVPEFSHEHSALFAWFLTRSKLRELIDGETSAENNHSENSKILLSVAGALNMLGLGNIHEPETLFVEPLNCLTKEEATNALKKLSGGLEPKFLEDLKLSILDTGLVRQYMPVRSVEVGSGESCAMLAQSLITDSPDQTGSPLCLFDNLYGMAIIYKDGRWRNVCFANWLWKSYILGMPPNLIEQHMKNTANSLSEGALIAYQIMAPILSDEVKKGFRELKVPELTLQEPEELFTLIQKMEKQITIFGQGLKLWFRGQTKDFLTPDRDTLVQKNITPYSSVRDSSLIPTLYRYIDDYTSTTSNFGRLVRHIGDWANNAKILLPPPYVILDVTGTKPYTPGPVPEKATSRVTFYMAGKPHMNIPSLRDLGPYTLTEITDENDNIIDSYIKLHNPSLQGFREMLLLQHYGCQTPYLDITHDPYIALWFALNKLITVPEYEGKLHVNPVKVIEGPPSEWPTIYVFILHPTKHPVIDTSDILKDSQFLRPKVQKCGLLGGAGNLARNYAARFIALKLRLGPKFLSIKLPSANEVFPTSSEDAGLKRLLELEANPDNDRLFKVYDVIQ